MSARAAFAIPGDLDTVTGGYLYEKRLLEGLREIGVDTAYLPVAGSFPDPSEEDVDATVATLQKVDPRLVEASRAMGATRGQILRKVRLKLALPEIMLGVNQTIMFALSMLVITALVGTRDLGQEVYIALTKADTGRGLVAEPGVEAEAELREERPAAVDVRHGQVHEQQAAGVCGSGHAP